MNGNMTNHSLYDFVLERVKTYRDEMLLAVILVAAGAVIYLLFRSLRNKKKPSHQNTDTEESPSQPSKEQYEFVWKRMKTYYDEMLRYELGLERYRRRASRDVLQKLLKGQEEVIAMPILYLNSDEWIWDQQHLQEAVRAALDELELPILPDIREPTTQAARACEEWAAKKAKRLFDEELCDSQK